MKLQKLLPEVTAKFVDFKNKYANELANHIAEVKSSKDYKDFATRIAWDVTRASFGRDRFDLFDRANKEGGNDSHLNTLFIAALKQSGIYSML